MPRKPRKNINYSISHVMIRGNNKQQIFYSDEDCSFFINLLKKAIMQYSFKIHLFCLMTNHVHLVTEVYEIPLNKIMQSINTQYAQYLNKKFNRVGHVFQGRYREKRVRTQDYLIELCYYIHMNPVAAGIVDDVAKYTWSSHHAYTGDKYITWVTTEHVVDLLIEKIKSDKKSAYVSFIYDREHCYAQLLRKAYDEDGFFILKNLPPKEKKPVEEKLNLTFFSIIEITEIVCNGMDTSMELVLSDSKIQSTVIARCLIAYYAHYFARHQLQVIAGLLCRKPDALSKTMHKKISCPKLKPKIKHWMNRIERDFKAKIDEIRQSKL